MHHAEEEDFPCFLGSVDLESFRSSLSRTFRTDLAHGLGLPERTETTILPHTGIESPGMSDEPAAGLVRLLADVRARAFHAGGQPSPGNSPRRNIVAIFLTRTFP